MAAPQVADVAAGSLALLGMGAVGAGAGMASQGGITWGELWGPLAFVLGLLVTLIGVVWKQHQSEVGALKGQLSSLDSKVDKLLEANHALAVTLAEKYVTKDDMRAELAVLRKSA